MVANILEQYLSSGGEVGNVNFGSGGAGNGLVELLLSARSLSHD